MTWNQWALALCSLILSAAPARTQSVFINEIHYDNDGADSGEAVEVAGPAGTNLTGWTLVLYNGSNGLAYSTLNLTGILPDQDNGFGVLSFSTPGIQNGSPDGLALVDALLNVVQFLCYEGTFAAVDGPAAGQGCTDIGASEASNAPIGSSLQLAGAGAVYGDFTWTGSSPNTFGAVNSGQSFGGGPSITRIYEIQGAGHTSPRLGQSVTTAGIVTAVAGNGFYLQDAAGDGDPNTSDGIFVYTAGPPSVAKGDQVSVAGTVAEFQPGDADDYNLTITEIVNPSVTVESAGALPAPVVLGAAGRMPPSEIIDNDGFAAFDPEQDGIDFYESLEGMLVQVNSAVAAGPTSSFGEIFVLPDGGAGATGRNARGAIVINAGDFNPERVQIDDTLFAGSSPTVSTGDDLGTIVGVVSYGFGNFEILPDTPLSAPVPGAPAPETTTLAPAPDQMTIATFNVENLDPGDGARFATLAGIIVNNLRCPDVLALQEIQDNDGPADSGETSADQTYAALIAAIGTQCGPAPYEFRDIAPLDKQDGGQPGANIRVGFLFNPGRVVSVDYGTPSPVTPVAVEFGKAQLLLNPSPGRIDPASPVFEDSRKPLAVHFIFRPTGSSLYVVNNHFNSKGGDSPLFGIAQPPLQPSLLQRMGQALTVNNFVDRLLFLNPKSKVVVLGDMNDFQFAAPLRQVRPQGALSDQELTNLIGTLPAGEQYTYIFEGNAQALDHILVSDALVNRAAVDVVHVNAEFADAASDHDPVLARLTFKLGDLNGDGVLTVDDGTEFAKAYGKSFPHPDYNEDADFKKDGIVDGLDRLIFIYLYQQANPAAAITF